VFPKPGVTPTTVFPNTVLPPKPPGVTQTPRVGTPGTTRCYPRTQNCPPDFVEPESLGDRDVFVKRVIRNRGDFARRPRSEERDPVVARAAKRHSSCYHCKGVVLDAVDVVRGTVRRGCMGRKTLPRSIHQTGLNLDPVLVRRLLETQQSRQRRIHGVAMLVTLSRS